MKTTTKDVGNACMVVLYAFVLFIPLVLATPVFFALDKVVGDDVTPYVWHKFMSALNKHYTAIHRR